MDLVNAAATNAGKAITEPSKKFRPPEWLTSTRARKSPYVPQIGDEVVYFRQGYKLYFEAVRQHKVYPLKSNDLKSLLPKKAPVQKLCKVKGINIEIKPSHLVYLRLKILDPKTGKATSCEFRIKYHNMANVVDFVVLKQVYDRGVERHWRPKELFKSLIDDRWHFGVVEAFVPFEAAHPECKFQSLRIMWKTGEQKTMSPWNLEPVSSVNPRKSKPVSMMDTSSSFLSIYSGGDAYLELGAAAEPVLVTADEIKALLYETRDHEWLDYGRDQECDRILQGLETIMGLSIAQHFNHPVDFNVYHNYAQEIAYPIDLNTIRERFENRYYRRINALIWDVRRIYINCKKFNEFYSKIVTDAALLETQGVHKRGLLH